MKNLLHLLDESSNIHTLSANATLPENPPKYIYGYCTYEEETGPKDQRTLMTRAKDVVENIHPDYRGTSLSDFGRGEAISGIKVCNG